MVGTIFCLITYVTVLSRVYKQLIFSNNKNRILFIYLFYLKILKNCLF